MAIKSDTSMTIRMNREVKQQAQEIFAELGLDMTTAINVFLRQAIRYKGFPFDVNNHTPNTITLEALQEVELMKENRLNSKVYDNVDDMMEELLK